MAPGNIRQKIVKHPWLVFLLLAAFQLPIELRAWSTDGGDQNHLGVVTLFVALAATCGLVELWKSEPPLAREWAGIAARALLLGIFLPRRPCPYRFAATSGWWAPTPRKLPTITSASIQAGPISQSIRSRCSWWKGS